MKNWASEKQKEYKIWIAVFSTISVSSIIFFGQESRLIRRGFDYVFNLLNLNGLGSTLFLVAIAPLLYLSLCKIFLKIKLKDNISWAIGVWIITYFLFFIIFLYLFSKSSLFIM
jgi:hypothetical protein